MSFPIGDQTGDGRAPPGQRVTEKWPVLTAGRPETASAADWDLTLEREDEDGARATLAQWDFAAFGALPVREIRCDIHCVTRWSKLDMDWRGVWIADVLEAACVATDALAASDPPIAYLQAECDGGYAANLKLADLLGRDPASGGFIGLAAAESPDAPVAPLTQAHGGPARLVVPKLYFWKSAKWVRRLVLSPYDRKGYWERLGYHNNGDPWREQRYRGLSDADARRTLDPELSRKIRQERLNKTD